LRRPGEAGFTMVELLVTLAVTVIGMTGAIALHLAITRANGGAAQQADAMAIAEHAIEDARSLTLDEMYTAYEDDDGALPIDWDYDGATEQGRTATYQKRILVEQVQGDLVRLRVEVSWGDHLIALELVRTRQETL
jgi:prepilin-type N-terminal cleavage/methylation domain-containing protein